MTHRDAWQDLGSRIEAELGLRFSDPVGLRRSFSRAMADFGFADELKCLAWVLERWPDAAVLQTLARHLTVGETYFLRDHPVFEALEKSVLPEMLRTRRATDRRLRIWCAACCTGEEAYTVAILLHRLVPDLPSWDISIQATDLNENFLAKARNGAYGTWSFRAAAAWMRSPYFERDGQGHHVVAPRIRRMVTFGTCNLVRYGEVGAPDFGLCDLILCRNVLMYFSAPRIESVVRRLQASLAPEGCLVVGAGEIGCVKSPALHAEYHPGAVLFRKRAPGARTRAPALFAVVPPVPVPAAAPRAAPARRPATGTASPEEMHVERAAENLEQRARALADQGEWGEALSCCDRWLSRDKLNAEGHYLKGMVLLESGDKRAALASMQHAVYVDSDHVAAYIALGRLESEVGQPRRARNAFDVARRLLRRDGLHTLPASGGGFSAGRLDETLQALMDGKGPVS